MNVAYFVVQQTMYFAIPLLIVAIGAMYSERSGVINIALEGIMVMGAFAGIFFINIFQGNLSGQGLFLLAMLVAGLTGGLFSLLHAFASINMKADQTISGTALNLFAPAFAIFTARMIQGMQQIQFTDTFHINKVPVLGDIPVIGDLFFQNCYISTYIGILIFAVAAFVIKNTRFGLRLRACGEHPGAADSVGVNIFTARMIQGMQQIQFTDTFHINKVPVLGDIPVIGDLFFQNCYISTYIGILIFAVAAFVIKNTRFGLRLRACGEHPGAADSVGVNVYKIRYAGVIISGVLGGIGGLIFVVPTSTNFNASVAGYGFLAIAVLIFGQWRSNKILMAAFFFGIMKTLSSAYSTIPFLKSLPIPNEVYKMIPYIATLIVLAFFSKNSQAPKAEGIPYDKGSR